MRLPAPLLRRKKDAHKNDFGHVLVVAGSPAMLGAAALTGLAAMRSGAGVTTIAVSKSLNLTLQAKVSPVIMTLPLPETRKGTIALKAFYVLKKSWKKYSAVAMGPGMSTDPGTVKFIERMYCECPLPMVVDADALNALAGKLDRFKKPAGSRVLTPHPGEMSRLTGLSVQKIQADRKGVARTYAKRWGVVVVLKGHETVVASSDGKVYVNKTGNAGMATAGSGDVLTGMVASFVASGMPTFEAAKQAVYWHGVVGDSLLKRKNVFGFLASDMAEEVAKMRRHFRSGHA